MAHRETCKTSKDRRSRRIGDPLLIDAGGLRTLLPVLLLLLCSLSFAAADINIPSFNASVLSQFSLNGTVMPSLQETSFGPVLQLAGLSKVIVNQAYWIEDQPEALANGFTTEFDFANVIGAALLADGLAFMLQSYGPSPPVNGSYYGPPLGWTPVMKPAIGVMLHTYCCNSIGPGITVTNDSSTVSTQIAHPLVPPVLFPSALYPLPNGTVLHTTITWQASGSLTVTVFDRAAGVQLATLSANIVFPDYLGDRMWVGFTSATGGSYADVWMLNWTFSALPACSGSPPIAGSICVSGVWTLGPNTTVSPTAISVSGNQTLVIQGTVDLPDNATVTIAVSPGGNVAPIMVDGSLTLNGNLAIQLPSEPVENNTVIPIITLGPDGVVNGTFAAVNVTGQKRSCHQTKGSFDRDSLAVIVSVDSSGCKKKGLSGGAIAGIVVGCVVFVAVVIVIVVLILRKVAPSSLLFSRRRRNPSSARRGMDESI